MSQIAIVLSSLGFQKLQKAENSKRWNLDIVAHTGYVAAVHPGTGKVLLTPGNRLERAVARLQYMLNAGIHTCKELQVAYDTDNTIEYYVKFFDSCLNDAVEKLFLEMYFKVIAGVASPVGRFAKSKSSGMKIDTIRRKSKDYKGRRFNTNQATNSKPIMVNGVEYLSVKEARRALNLSYHKLVARLNSDEIEWAGWVWL